MRFSWHKVYDFNEQGKEPQPLHSVRAVEVQGKSVCMARLDDGYYAIDDSCPHAGAHLSGGRCDEQGYVICPVHRYRYDARTGKGKQGDYVEPYPVETRPDGVYIGLKQKRWWWPF